MKKKAELELWSTVKEYILFSPVWLFSCFDIQYVFLFWVNPIYFGQHSLFLSILTYSTNLYASTTNNLPQQHQNTRKKWKTWKYVNGKQIWVDSIYVRNKIQSILHPKKWEQILEEVLGGVSRVIDSQIYF